MISQQQAYNYQEQLHPAFAGYLHDGTVNQRDVLATIFHLFTKDVLTPEFAENSMLKQISGIRRGSRKPQFVFEQLLVDGIMQNSDHVTSHQVGKLINQGYGEEVIKAHVSVIEKFPIINNKLRFSDGKITFSLNGEAVDSIEKAKTFKIVLQWILLPVFLFVGGILLISAFFPAQYSGMVTITSDLPDADTKNIFLYTGGMFVVIPTIMLLAFLFSKKSVTYSFEHNVVPKAKAYYDQLYTYMKAHPLKEHVFTNEFLPHAIAFGLDDSWQKDFGLTPELSIDEATVA